MGERPTASKVPVLDEKLVVISIYNVLYQLITLSRYNRAQNKRNKIIVLNSFSTNRVAYLRQILPSSKESKLCFETFESLLFVALVTS